MGRRAPHGARVEPDALVGLPRRIAREPLSVLRFRTYDAVIVSEQTVGARPYRTTPAAPWLVREASPPARPPRPLDQARGTSSEARRHRPSTRRCCRLRVKDVDFAANQIVVATATAPGALLRKYPQAARTWAWQWVPRHTILRGSRHRAASAPSSSRVRSAACRQGRSPRRRHPKARRVPHPATLFRHAPARGQPRYPDGPGAPRAP